LRTIEENRFVQLPCHDWAEHCDRYLPFTSLDAKWRYSRYASPNDPDQGWKLHLSATILTAAETLQKVAQFLHGHEIVFKAPATLIELSRINSGVYYGYSQVGKFITVYPRSNKEAVFLAKQLDHLTRGMPAPPVPFDRQFSHGSCIYYRYGSFRSHVVKSPTGELLPDSAEFWESRFDWAADPLIETRPKLVRCRIESTLQNRFRVFRALRQRGKGGVYQAIDMAATPTRLCILKEGRRHGETSEDGSDGYWRVKNEERNLSHLRSAGIEVPEIFSAFEVEGHYYLVLEFIAGETLEHLLKRRKRRLAIEQVIHYGIQLSQLLSQIHAAGWAWRDCKPGNLLITTEGRMRPLDFEGACPINQISQSVWWTPDFTPPEYQDKYAEDADPVAADRYALGAILYLLVTGRYHRSSSSMTVNKLRRGVPEQITSLISELLSFDPQQRPEAATTAKRLSALSA